MKNEEQERIHPSDVADLPLLDRGRWAAREMRYTQATMEKMADAQCKEVAFGSGVIAQVLEDLVEQLSSGAK